MNSIVGRLPDEEATTARLLRNADDFAAAFAPYYGSAVAGEFGRLLREHLVLAAAFLKAKMSGNTANANDVRRRWFGNADNIAAFLDRINPYWSKSEWQTMLYNHLNLLTREMETRIAGNYAENVALSDRIETQALMMADVLTTGLVRQFPAAFSR